ncbi:MAG: hypothetical protein KKG99_10585 [Bacteroidetes bacterium]|nr:hypothetical protein [Bacteroidota bacterium]
MILVSGFTFKGFTQETIDYQKIILTADSLFNKGNYIDAKAYYQYALKLQPNNQDIKSRLTKSIELLKSQGKERETYTDYILKADHFYKKEDLENAFNTYQQAIELFPFEKYPNKQVEKIKNRIQEKQLLEQEYQSVIHTADTYFDNAEYKKAKIEYQFAISLIPAEAYPKTKLNELNRLIADQSFMLKIYAETILIADSSFAKLNYNYAKEYYQKAADLQPNEIYPRDQITQIILLLNPINEYNSLIEQADNYYMVKDFTSARNFYESAAQLKPADPYPAEMISKVIEAIESKATSDQEDFENAIKTGNQHFSNNELKEAKLQFEFANRIKPDGIYSKNKLIEIDQLIDSIQNIGLIDVKYTEAIQKADLFFSANELLKAKGIYSEVLSFKSNDVYAQEKLKEIENAFRIIEDQKNLETSYANTLSKAEDFLIKKDYGSAKTEFQYAATLKPNEDYPKTKIVEIDSILIQIEASQMAEENYLKTIKEADVLFEQNLYTSAQNSYKKSLNYKPEEEYPKNKLAEIQQIFQIQREELDKAYNLAISNAQNDIAKGQLQSAKTFLNEALTLKPEETYPRITIQQIDNQIAESKQRALAQYQPLLVEADQYFKQKTYDRALSFYNQASDLLPDELYPASRINEILQIIRDATNIVLVDSSTLIENNQLRQFNFEQVAITDRKSNYILLSMCNTDAARNLKIILNFGKDQLKNGGIIIRLNEKTSSQDYLINIGNQYKWFSENNNWISIQTEGGAVEISKISISKIN